MTFLGGFRRVLVVALVSVAMLLLASTAGAQSDEGSSAFAVSSGGAEVAAGAENDPGPALGSNGGGAEYLAEYYDVDPAELFAESGPESVKGKDQRNQIRNPWKGEARKTGLLVFSPGGGTSICTAELIGPHTIATAGHCVHPGGTGSTNDFYDETTYTFFPGYSAGFAPFGSCSIQVGQLWTATAWVDSADHRFDWGAAQLESCTLLESGGTETAHNIGNVLGWMGFTHKGNPDNGGTLIWGYPGDKITPTKPPTNWFSFGETVSSTPRKLFYNNDTAGGMSGSAIQQPRGGKCQHCLVGIHAYGFGTGAPSTKFNSGTKLDAALTAFLKDLRADLV